MEFKPLKYTQEECGKKVPNSKRIYRWIFDLDSQRYQLQLICSFISGKRIVTLNNTTIHQTKNFNMKFQFEHYINSHILKIVQSISYFSLFVDNSEFISLLKLNHQKSKQRRQRQRLQQSNINPINSQILQNKYPFQQFKQFQNIGYQQKSVVCIKTSDFDNFHQDDKQQGIIDIQLSHQDQKQIHNETTFQIQNNNKNGLQNAEYPNQDIYLQQERNAYHQQNKVIFLTENSNNAYIPTPKQIFKEKTKQIMKFFKL